VPQPARPTARPIVVTTAIAEPGIEAIGMG
jgi:hypothetical protein